MPPTTYILAGLILTGVVVVVVPVAVASAGVCLAAVVVCAPFVGAYKLAKYTRKKVKIAIANRRKQKRIRKKMKVSRKQSKERRQRSLSYNTLRSVDVGEYDLVASENELHSFATSSFSTSCSDELSDLQRVPKTERLSSRHFLDDVDIATGFDDDEWLDEPSEKRSWTDRSLTDSRADDDFRFREDIPNFEDTDEEGSVMSTDADAPVVFDFEDDGAHSYSDLEEGDEEEREDDGGEERGLATMAKGDSEQCDHSSDGRESCGTGAVENGSDEPSCDGHPAKSSGRNVEEVASRRASSDCGDALSCTRQQLVRGGDAVTWAG